MNEKKPSKRLQVKVPTEAREAMALKTWADYHPIAKHYLFHVPNGGSRNLIEAKNLKQQGVKPGVFDYFFAYPCKDKHGMWIELKRASKSLSRVSQEQAAFAVSMEKVGYHTVIAYGWEDAVKKIEKYLT